MDAVRRIIVVVGLWIVAAAPAAAREVSSFIFDGWDGPPLKVHFVEPKGAGPDAPVVFVMHGVRRNADDYRDNWIALAREHGFRIYAPAFSRKDFPGADHYNLGSVGFDRPSAYDAIEPLYDAVLARTGGAERGYVIFGHSAGAQFVHRALLFADMPRLRRAYAANAGWYTLPDETVAWPYGAGVTTTAGQGPDLLRWFRTPMTVLLGDADTDPQDPNLRRTPEAMAQGPHRFARGHHFMTVAETQARKAGANLNWSVQVVPGVAHDNAGMAVAAVAMIANDN